MSSSSICAEHPLGQVLVQREHTCCASLAVRYLIDMVQGKLSCKILILCHSSVICGEHVRFYQDVGANQLHTAVKLTRTCISYPKLWLNYRSVAQRQREKKSNRYLEVNLKKKGNRAATHARACTPLFQSSCRTAPAARQTGQLTSTGPPVRLSSSSGAHPATRSALTKHAGWNAWVHAGFPSPGVAWITTRARSAIGSGSSSDGPRPHDTSSQRRPFSRSPCSTL